MHGFLQSARYAVGRCLCCGHSVGAFRFSAEITRGGPKISYPNFLSLSGAMHPRMAGLHRGPEIS